jgi:hypothetical protein
MSYLTNDTLVALREINEANSQVAVFSLNGKYINNHQPDIDYHIGIKAYLGGLTDIAKKRFISCAIQGTKPPYIWFDKVTSNSIGQSIYLLLTQNLLKTTDQEVIAKLFVFSYLNLSSCINQIGDKAYESYEARYLIFEDCNYKNIVYNYLHHIGVKEEMIFMLNAYDLYQSSLGYTSALNFTKAVELSDKASSIINFINQEIATFPTTEVFLLEAEDLHKKLYNKLYNFMSMSITIDGEIK